MPLPTVPDHYYVQAIFQREGNDEVVNTFCFHNQRDVPGESHTSQALLESMRDLLDSFYGPTTNSIESLNASMSPKLHNLRYTVLDLGQPLAGASEIMSATWPEEPAGTASSAPPDVALVITWRTALRGRSYRGRTYLGPLHSGAIAVTGLPNSNLIDRCSNAAPKLIGAEATRDWQICVLSRKQGVATPVTSADVDHEFDTQRRRGISGAPRTLIAAP